MDEAAEEEGFRALPIGYTGNDNTTLDIAASQVQPLLERLLDTFPPRSSVRHRRHSMGRLVSRTLIERDDAVDARGNKTSR